MRDGLRLLEEREHKRRAKLDALREDVNEGLANGASEPLGMSEIKSVAWKARSTRCASHGA